MKQVFLLGFFLSIFLAACSTQSGIVSEGTMTLRPTPTVTVPPRPTLDSGLVAVGQVVYEAHCASCHGAALEGEPNWSKLNEDGSYRAPAHDASGHTWHHSDGRLIEIIKLGGTRVSPDVGVSKMPPYVTVLTDAEIAAVLSYIKASWPEEARQMQWEVTVRERR